jgi:hypothetical protein
MAKDKDDMKISISVDIRKCRRKHCQHLSGAGEHDNRPKRSRTREREKNQWKNDQAT